MNVATEDKAAPSCAQTGTGTDAQGRKYIQVTTRDTGSGLARITVRKDINVTMAMPSFTPAPATPRWSRPPRSTRPPASQVELEVADIAGNKTVCDPILVTVASDGGRRRRG